jgi:hypothetical protein
VLFPRSDSPRQTRLHADARPARRVARGGLRRPSRASRSGNTRGGGGGGGTADVASHALMLGVPARRVGVGVHLPGRRLPDPLCLRLRPPFRRKKRGTRPDFGAGGVAVIDFSGLRKQYETPRGSIAARHRRGARRGSYIGGGQIAQLENKLAADNDTRFCLCCASGTDALVLSLMAWGTRGGGGVPAVLHLRGDAEAVALRGGDARLRRHRRTRST